MSVVYHVGKKRSTKQSKRGNSCRGKIKHFSYESALKHIQSLRKRKLILGWYHIYPCKWCSKEATKYGQ